MSTHQEVRTVDSVLAPVALLHTTNIEFRLFHEELYIVVLSCSQCPELSFSYDTIEQL